MVDTRFHAFSGAATLGDLLQGLKKVDLVPNVQAAATEVTGAEELEIAGTGHVALAANRKYVEALHKTSASVVIIGNALKDDVPEGSIAIIAPDPHGLFVELLGLLYPSDTRSVLLALCDPKAGAPIIEDGAIVSRHALIGAGAEIGSGTVIGPNTTIGAGVAIGRDCLIGANVTIECAYLGNHVVVQAGARIGGEGFGWLEHGRANKKIPQLGRVIIQDRVEVGANSTIDRGALGDTTIGEGTKIDNLVQIGHNCKIGRYCLIAATSGLSGTTVVEDSVLMGGGTGTSGHMTIGAGSIVHGRAAVTKDWPAGSKLAGAPAQDIKDFWRETAAIRRLTKGDET